jgi:hypothetical protein
MPLLLFSKKYIGVKADGIEELVKRYDDEPTFVMDYGRRYGYICMAACRCSLQF